MLDLGEISQPWAFYLVQELLGRPIRVKFSEKITKESEGKEEEVVAEDQTEES